MGMFDDLRCHYPLPVPGANARDYQTKDTPCQCLSKYEITADGVLRHKAWDAEEGRTTQWIGHPDFVGEVCFYNYEKGSGWIECVASMVGASDEWDYPFTFCQAMTSTRESREAAARARESG